MREEAAARGLRLTPTLRAIAPLHVIALPSRSLARTISCNRNFSFFWPKDDSGFGEVEDWVPPRGIWLRGKSLQQNMVTLIFRVQGGEASMLQLIGQGVWRSRPCGGSGGGRSGRGCRVVVVVVVVVHDGRERGCGCRHAKHGTWSHVRLRGHVEAGQPRLVRHERVVERRSQHAVGLVHGRPLW